MPSPSQVQATITSTSRRCICQPSPVVFLLLTLVMTSSATAMLCAAIMTDHWEHVTWDGEALNNLANTSGQTLHWLLDGKVARLPIEGQINRGGIFLVPMNGGIWTLCIDLDDHELRQLGRWGFPRTTKCINYLAGNSSELDPQTQLEEPRAIWQHRMQNLSISCSLVCLIILGSSALVGAFGICQRQVSAVLVTGVMYLLAALFALFALMIIHFKRQQGRQLLESDFDGTIDGLVAAKGSASAAQNLLGARIFYTAWSLDLGWGGVALTSLTSFLWISLSKIMRLNPLTSMI